MRKCFGKSFSGIWFAASDNARRGFSCTSMKIPSHPVAIAARASIGASAPSPEVLSPPPPGRDQIVVAECRPPFRETKFPAAERDQFVGDIFHVPRCEKLSLLHVHRAL